MTLGRCLLGSRNPLLISLQILHGPVGKISLHVLSLEVIFGLNFLGLHLIVSGDHMVSGYSELSG